MNENVIILNSSKNSKTPEKSTSLAFFFIFIFNVYSMSIQCRLLRCFRLILKKIKYIKKQNYIINKHTIDRFKVVADKDMRKMLNIVENLIRRYVESRV